MAEPIHIYYFSLNQIPLIRATNFKWLYESVRNGQKKIGLLNLPHYATLVKKVKQGDTVPLHSNSGRLFTFTRHPVLARALQSEEVFFDNTLF